MIVFYEHHIEQAGTVINATASDNRRLLQHAQPRGRFARIEYFGRMITNRINKLPCERRDAAEALKKIQRHAFGFEDRPRNPAQFDNGITGNYRFAVSTKDLDVGLRIDLPKDFRSRPRSSNNPRFMRNYACIGTQLCGNEKLSRDVALAYVFSQCCSDWIVIIRVHGGAAVAPYV